MFYVACFKYQNFVLNFKTFVQICPENEKDNVAYFPQNLVSLDYVTAILNQYSNAPAETFAAVKSEAIQKLGELAAYYGNQVQAIAAKYQLQINRQQVVNTVTTITGAVATAVPVPIVQGLGVLLSLGSVLIQSAQAKKNSRAQAEIEALQGQMAAVQSALQDLSPTDNPQGSSTTIIVVIGLVLLFLYRSNRTQNNE
jgi:hypothetical protein